MATKNFIEELEWRGMIHTIMPGAKEQLEKEMTTAYLGIDPTADSLHIGHLVGVMILKHFQMCGHRPLALIGGATGMIGDPSGKSQERNLLDEPTLRHNQEAIKRQLAKLLDFESDAPNAAVQDDVRKTVNYLTVYEVVRMQMRITQHTIERVAMNIIEAIYAAFAQVRHVKCTVSKLAPPLGGKLEKVSVVLEK